VHVCKNTKVEGPPQGGCREEKKQEPQGDSTVVEKQ
jgi:hypothetical protein